jgi:ribosomal protein S18 acetylase RimI-like enzyme
MNLHFRKATLDDLSFLVGLRKLTMADHLENAGLIYTEQDHRERVFDNFEDSLIMQDAANSIGLLKLAQLQDRLHIRQLQIMPKYQRQGIGALVLKQIQHRALKLQVPVTLNVLHKNPALALYQRAGFVIVEQNDLEFLMLCNLVHCQQNLQTS